LPESNVLAGLLVRDRQLILPLLELVEQAQCAIDDLVDVMGRATIDAVWPMSAQQLAGPRQQGRTSDRDIVYHRSQPGRVKLQERQLKVTKPRLRKMQRSEGESGEVELPAYAAMHDDARLADRMLYILMRGVSPRNYAEVLREMAETVGHRGGIVRHGVSRQVAPRNSGLVARQSGRAGPRARSRASSSRRANACSRHSPNGTSRSRPSW
jgi:hypothetical protein